jgi:L-lysine exporter family protein LysE/ArgO
MGVEILLTVHWLKPVITLLGVGFLFVMGTILFRKSETNLEDDTRQLTIVQQITFTLALALLNPHALLDTFVVIGSVSTAYVGAEKQAFALGCIFIDALWFTALSICGFYIKKMNAGPKLIVFLNKASAIIMFYIAIDLLKDYFTLST